MDVKQKLSELPAKSGVYLMMDKDGTVIYVGKAKILKNRVKQYFQAGTKTDKTLALVGNIADFRYIITQNEVDALVLENNLIKKYNPKYNILLKDDKNYPFIRIDLKSKFPTVEVVRKLKNDGAKYFGPYMVGINVKDITELIFSAFPLRSCNLNFDKIPAHHRPCLNSHIGRCLAPCDGRVPKEEYAKTVSEVISFLKGNDDTVKKVLEMKMHRAADNGDFENAIYYRDRLKTLDKLVRRQISALPKDFNLDVFSVIDNGIYAAVSVLVVRGGKLLGGDNFPLPSAAKSVSEEETLGLTSADIGTLLTHDEAAEMLENFIFQYYEQNPVFPDEVVINVALSDVSGLENVFFDKSGKRINFVKPIQGVRKQLVEMAENNAVDYLSNFVTKLVRRDNMTKGAVVKLAEELGLSELPRRIECYDISHVSGTNMVASMVVFEDGEPAKKMYRSYKIKTVPGNNDFACMKEVLTRRLTRLKNSDPDPSFGKRPDLIIVDGGKGQLSYAMEALEETDMTDVNIVSLAKREEEVFFPDRHEPVVIDRNSVALKLIQRVRDEAHRSAITHHRNLRTAGQTKSELKDVEGIGDKKIAALYAKFKNLKAIKAATVEELSAVKGVTKKDAERIKQHFSD